MEKTKILGSSRPQGGTEPAAPSLTAQYMDWKVDWAFKKVFADKEVMMKLLRDILREDIVDLEYLPNEIPVVSEKDKRSMFDVLCRTSNGRKFICEMQKKAEADLQDRLFFYGSHLVVNQVKRGDREYLLSPVYVLCITGFEMDHTEPVPEGKILFDYRFREVDLGDDLFADRMNICVLELPRLGRTKPFDEMTDSAEKWAYMFQNIATFAGQPETIREFRHAMEVSRVDTLTPEEQNQYHDAMVSEYEKLVISEAYEQIGLKKGREEGRAEGRAEGRVEGRAEGRAEGIAEGRAEGMEKGMKKGMEQGKMEVARQMKKMGLSIAQIVQASGLPEEVVKGL